MSSPCFQKNFWTVNLPAGMLTGNSSTFSFPSFLFNFGNGEIGKDTGLFSSPPRSDGRKLLSICFGTASREDSEVITIFSL